MCRARPKLQDDGQLLYIQALATQAQANLPEHSSTLVTPKHVIPTLEQLSSTDEDCEACRQVGHRADLRAVQGRPGRWR